MSLRPQNEVEEDGEKDDVGRFSGKPAVCEGRAFVWTRSTFLKWPRPSYSNIEAWYTDKVNLSPSPITEYS